MSPSETVGDSYKYHSALVSAGIISRNNLATALIGTVKLQGLIFDSAVKYNCRTTEPIGSVCDDDWTIEWVIYAWHVSS